MRRRLLVLLVAVGVWVEGPPIYLSAAPLPAPPAPSRPVEGLVASRDEDFDSDGLYRVLWAAVRQAGSRILLYELQESTSPAGPWVGIGSTRSTSYLPRRKSHAQFFVYRVRAQNAAGLWSAWSVPSDGILVDRTPPTAVTVTDDGAASASTDTLHARWSASSDPESGILGYDYEIRQDRLSGKALVTWKSVGMVQEVTHTNLRLANGSRYFIGVRAKNRAGLYSLARYSDGITIRPTDTTPPKIVIVYPKEGALLGAR